MLTQISFTADKTLKKKAMEKAKSEGLTLKAFLVSAMKGFVEGTITMNISIKEQQIKVEEMPVKDKKIKAKAQKLAQLLR